MSWGLALEVEAEAIHWSQGSLEVEEGGRMVPAGPPLVAVVGEQMDLFHRV